MGESLLDLSSERQSRTHVRNPLPAQARKPIRQVRRSILPYRPSNRVYGMNVDSRRPRNYGVHGCLDRGYQPVPRWSRIRRDELRLALDGGFYFNQVNRDKDLFPGGMR